MFITLHSHTSPRQGQAEILTSYDTLKAKVLYFHPSSIQVQYKFNILARRCLTLVLGRWLISFYALTSPFQYHYNEESFAPNVVSLIKIVMNTLDAQHHVCRRIPPTVVMGGPPSRSRGEIDFYFFHRPRNSQSTFCPFFRQQIICVAVSTFWKLCS